MSKLCYRISEVPINPYYETVDNMCTCRDLIEQGERAVMKLVRDPGLTWCFGGSEHTRKADCNQKNYTRKTKIPEDYR